MVLDPADDERPVGINPLRSVSTAGTEVVVENLVGLFRGGAGGRDHFCGHFFAADLGQLVECPQDRRRFTGQFHAFQ